jgi:hypothetical protein
VNPNEVQRQMTPKFMSAAEVLAMPPDATRWLWDKTLPSGQSSILVAKPKVGKSTLAANLCLAIARGIPFLGRDTQKAPVAYLSLDATLEETKEIFTDFSMVATDTIFFYSAAVPVQPIPWLMQQIREKGIRFAVVDTLQRFFHFQDANAYAEVNNRMEPLLDAARRQKCHILFLHHAKKGEGDDLDSSIGSQAIRGLCYSFIHLKRLPHSDKRVLRSDQRRGENFDELAIGFGANGWLEIAGTMEEAEIQIAKPLIIKVLDGSEELTESEIRGAIPMRGWIVGRAIRQLDKAGEIEKTGKGKRGSPYRYSTLAGSSGLSVSDALPTRGDARGETVSRPNIQVLGNGVPGLESTNGSQHHEISKEVSRPNITGRESDENGQELFGIKSGTRIQESSKRGVTTADVVRIFPGARVTQ